MTPMDTATPPQRHSAPSASKWTGRAGYGLAATSRSSDVASGTSSSPEGPGSAGTKRLSSGKLSNFVTEVCRGSCLRCPVREHVLCVVVEAAARPLPHLVQVKSIGLV